MKTHIEFAHLRLVSWRKLGVSENVIETNDNPQQGKINVDQLGVQLGFFWFHKS